MTTSPLVALRPRRPRGVERRPDWRRVALLAPSVVLFLAVFVTAIESAVEYSFQLYSPDGAYELNTVASWTKFLTSRYYLSVIADTLVIGLLVTVITAVLGYLTAFTIYSMRSRVGRAVLNAVVFSSLIFSGIASVYSWQLVLGEAGFLNQLLRSVGLAPVRLLYERSAVVLALVHTLLPMMMLPILTSLNQVDGSYDEAALDMGASRVRRFLRITLPLSWPGLVAGAQLTFALAISSFTAPALLGGGRVSTLSTSVYNLVGTADFPLASVAAIVLLVLALASTGLFVLVHRRVGEVSQGGSTFVPARPKGVRWLSVWVVLVTVFQVLPAAIVVISSFSSVPYGVWPPPGYSTRWYTNLLQQDEVLGAAGRSLVVATVVAVLAGVFGTAASLVFSRRRFRGAGAVQSMLFTPVIVPKIAFGFAVFMFLGRLGLSGGPVGVVLAHTVAATPFVISLVMAALARSDRTLDDAALDLGASPLTVFLRSTLPQVFPAAMLGVVFAFLMSFNEVDLSIFLLSSDNQTLPVWMFGYLNNYQDPTPAALSTLMSVFSLVLVAVLVGGASLLGRRRRSAFGGVADVAGGPARADA